MSIQSNNKYKGFERSFCIRMKSTLTKRGCQFKQSTGHRVSESEFMNLLACPRSRSKSSDREISFSSASIHQIVHAYFKDGSANKPNARQTNGHYSVRKIDSIGLMCDIVNVFYEERNISLSSSQLKFLQKSHTGSIDFPLSNDTLRAV
jgi:hypothetical protein